jgi:hypothetical protein
MFYSDCFNSIPEGIVNKKVCGCGITSYALENASPIILCVPTVEIIRNKLSQYPNERRKEEILGIYEGKNKHSYQIESYLDKVDVPKILVTYDSLHYLTPYLNMFHLVIDEFSELLDCYSFRSNAINSLVEIIKAKRYQKLSLVSATPISSEYLPAYLQELPYTELDWKEDDLIKVNVVPIQTSRTVTSVLNIIKNYKRGLVKDSNQAFFFVNSLSLITSILEKSDLTTNDVHVVCSNTRANKNRLDYFSISTTTDVNNTPRMFNFFTSTAFKGCDIYSESGMSYVISNNTNINTLLTIDTDIYQIAGRIRTPHNPHRHTLYHIHNQNPLALAKEDADNLRDSIKQETLSLIAAFDKASPKERKDLINIYLKSNIDKTTYSLIDKENTKLIYDELKELLDKRVYETVIKVYQSGLSLIKTYEDNNYIVKETIKSNVIRDDFSTVFKLYYQNPNCNNEDIFTRFPLIEEACTKLGLERCKTLAFRKDRITEELSFVNNQESIKNLLRNRLKKEFYSLADIKLLLGKTYKELGINKKAKAKDIELFLPLSETTLQIKGKRVKGYRIK